MPFSSRSLLVVVAFRNRLDVGQALLKAGVTVVGTTSDRSLVDSTIEVETNLRGDQIQDIVWGTAGLGQIFCQVKPPAFVPVPDKALPRMIRSLYTPDELAETLSSGVSMKTIRAWARRSKRVPS